MASVCKRAKSPFFTACFTDRNGRQLKRSTKTTDRKQALQIAIELERVEQQARQGSVTTIQLAKVFNGVSERITGDSMTTPSVHDYLKGWLEGVKARNTPGTLERYQNAVTLFEKSLGPKAEKPLTSVTAADVERFSNQRLNSGSAPKTVIVDLKTLNTAFRRAEDYGIILKNPVKAVRMPKSESSEREIFTQDEVKRLLDAAPNLEWQTLILLGYFTGARLGDCVRLKWENVHPDDSVIVYEQKKTGKKVIVPMHIHIVEHLNHLAQYGCEGFLCPELCKKDSGGKHGLSESFNRIVKKAGIDPMTVQGKGKRMFTMRTFHSLRHSFNSALANAGVSEEVRMKLTGHSTKAMNVKYTHLQVDTLKTAVTTLPMFNTK